MRHHITESQIEDLRGRCQSSQILKPGEDGFAERLQRWSQAAVKPAGAILLATAWKDISIAVSFCNDHGIDMAVCGGGHSTSGASSSTGGLVIDLSLMRKVSVDPVEKTVCAEGGCTWADVDDAAAAHGLACVGGTVRHTGVGGLTLGGGYGWLSGLYGLAIDNLLAATVIVADGTILQVSPVHHAELFWALRGAGQNFCVAVEFVMRAYDQKTFWGGLLAFQPSTLPSVIEFWNEVVVGEDPPGILTGGVAFVRLPPNFELALLVPVLHFGPETTAESTFRPLLELGPIFAKLDVHRWPEANSLLPAPYGFRTSMKGGLFRLPLSTTFVQDLFENYAAFTDRCPDARGSVLMLEMLHAKKVCEVASTATAFVNRAPHCNAQVIPFWTKAENDGLCRHWAREISQRIEDEFNAYNSQPEGSDRSHYSAYGNYCHSADGAKRLFGSNYNQLETLKKKFDPNNLFNKLFAITSEL